MPLTADEFKTTSNAAHAARRTHAPGRVMPGVVTRHPIGVLADKGLAAHRIGRSARRRSRPPTGAMAALVVARLGVAAAEESARKDSTVPVAIIRDRQRTLNSEAFHHTSQIDDIVAALRCDDDQYDFGLRLLYSGASLRASSEEHSDE